MARGADPLCNVNPLTNLTRFVLILAAASLPFGPYDIQLQNTPRTPNAQGSARLIFAESPFGVAVTADGHASYDVQFTIAGLPAPSSLGAYTSWVAWGVTPDLKVWRRLGAVGNGSSTVGRVEFNKFMLVVAAESDSLVVKHAGPIALSGTSPSGWLQTFLSHPLFRGVAP
jgi:hypothetical protein